MIGRVAFACLLSMLACNGAPAAPEVVDISHERTLVPSWEEYRQQAVRGPVDGKIIYALDGDQYTDSEDVLRAHYDALSSSEYEPKLGVFRQLSTGFEPVLSGDAALSIRYCVSDQFQNFPPYSKQTMIDRMVIATAAWESVANVRFAYSSGADANCTDQTTSVDFALIPSTWSDYSGCGANKLLWYNGCPVTGPFSANVKGVIAVNLPNLFSYETLQGLLMHELGHILGFRHEHIWNDSGCGQRDHEQVTDSTLDLTGRRLTDYDIPSVMHYHDVCGKPQADYSLSPLDGEGSRSIYGMPAAWYVPAVLATL